MNKQKTDFEKLCEEKRLFLVDYTLEGNESELIKIDDLKGFNILSDSELENRDIDLLMKFILSKKWVGEINLDDVKQFLKDWKERRRE